MKKLIMHPGKYFCLMLGIFIFTLSVPVFGQEELDEFLLRGVGYDFNASAENVKKCFSDVKQVLSRSYILMNETCLDFNSKLEVFENAYDNFIIQEDKVLTHTRMLPVANEYNLYTIVAEGRYLNNSSMYRISSIREQDKIILTKLNLFKRIFSYNIHKFSGIKNSHVTLIDILPEEDAKELKACINYMETRFGEPLNETLKDFELYQREVAPKLSGFFRDGIKPEEIMEFAFPDMSSKEKAGIRLILLSRDNTVKPDVLIKAIRDYNNMTKNCSSELSNKIKDIDDPFDPLSKRLMEMSSVERSKYVDEIVELTPGSQKFMKDFDELGLLKKRYIRKSITKGFGGLTALAAVATAAYIVDIAADNHFNAGYTMSNRELAIIGKKIENGTASFKEKFAFFTNPLSKKFVETDSVYTLSFVQLASDIYAADELLKGLKQAQEQETNDKVEQGVIKNIDKQIGTADFGVGSL